MRSQTSSLPKRSVLPANKVALYKTRVGTFEVKTVEPAVVAVVERLMHLSAVDEASTGPRYTLAVYSPEIRRTYVAVESDVAGVVGSFLRAWQCKAYMDDVGWDYHYIPVNGEDNPFPEFEKPYKEPPPLRIMSFGT